MEENPETQAQNDKDILQCRVDILRAHRAGAAVLKQEPSGTPSTDSKAKVEPPRKDPAKVEQVSQAQSGVKAGTVTKSKEPTKSQVRSEHNAEKETGAKPEHFRSKVQADAEQEAKVSVDKVLEKGEEDIEKALQEVTARAEAAGEKAEAEAKARAEAEQKVRAEQELKTAAQMAQQEAKAARIKAQDEARAAIAKAQQESAARIEAEGRAKSEAEARARAEQEAKAAAEKAQQEAKARAEAEEKVKSESEARVKAEQEAKAAVAKAQQESAARIEAEEKAKYESEARAKAEQEAKAKLDQRVKVQGRPEEVQDTTGERSEDALDKAEPAGVTRPAEGTGQARKEIPRLDLTRNILAEQRRAASMQRGKPMEQGPGAKVRPATGTIGRIIRETKKDSNGGIGVAVKTELQLSYGAGGVVPTTAKAYVATSEGAGHLSPEQQEVIVSIVALDIARSCADEGLRRDELLGRINN